MFRFGRPIICHECGREKNLSHTKDLPREKFTKLQKTHREANEISCRKRTWKIAQPAYKLRIQVSCNEPSNFKESQCSNNTWLFCLKIGSCSVFSSTLIESDWHLKNKRKSFHRLFFLPLFLLTSGHRSVTTKQTSDRLSILNGGGSWEASVNRTWNVAPLSTTSTLTNNEQSFKLLQKKINLSSCSK